MLRCIITIVVMLMLASCRHEEKRTVLARVGDAELTLEAAKEHVDTARGSFESQLRLYVASWVNNELVYLEAKRNGIEGAKQFAAKITEVQQEIASQMFLEEYIASDTASMNDTARKEYYENHRAEFFVHENMIKLNILLFANREGAGAFAASVSQRGNWSISVNKLLADSAATGSVTVMPTQYYSQHTLYPSELWKVASTLSINEVSFPVKTSNGYAVLQPIAALKEGTPADYDIVRDEVRERMLMEHRRRRYEELLGNLRKRFNVEVLIDSHSQSDSTQSHVDE